MEEMFLLKKDKFSSGLIPLDLILEGGYPIGSTIAVIGPVGFEKALLGIHLMAAEGKNYYVTFDMHPSQVIEKAYSYNIPIKIEKFLDGYSKPAGVTPREEDILINGPTALNDISLEISQIVKQPQPKLFFHSFSTLMLNNPLSSLSKFLQVIAGRVKENKGLLMLLFEDGLHKADELMTMLKNVDYTINITKENNVWTMKSQLFASPVMFDVGINGIEIL